jgi:hypothetical protein
LVRNMGKIYFSNIERDENGKLIKVVEIRDTDNFNQKPDIRVLPYDASVSGIAEDNDGSVKVKTFKVKDNERNGTLDVEYTDY